MDFAPDLQPVFGIRNWPFSRLTAPTLELGGKGALKDLASNLPRKLQIKRITLYVITIGIVYSLDIWLELLLYWFVPFNTALLLFLYWRLIAEHGAIPDSDSAFGKTRHIDPHWWERPFFAPNGVNYHLDHHLYPSVPFYNLKKLHQLLLDDAGYRHHAHTTKGYLSGLWRECVNNKPSS